MLLINRRNEGICIISSINLIILQNSMIKGDLNKLLFRIPFLLSSGEHKPLFRFQSDLAEAVIQTSEVYSSKTQEKLRPYINQSLKPGGSKFEKPMSPEMQNAIINVIKSKLSPSDPLYNNIEEEFHAAYNRLKSISQSASESNIDEYSELIEWQTKSNLTIILNREPSEAKWANNEDFIAARELINYMVENLFSNFNLDKFEFCNNPNAIRLKSNNRNEQFMYRFYVPSFTVAKQFWAGLLKFITFEVLADLYKQKPLSELIELAGEIIYKFNYFETPSNNTKSFVEFLKIYKVDGYVTDIPKVYFESASGIQSVDSNNKDYEILFTLAFYNEKLFSIGKITGADLNFWKEQVCYPLHWSNNNNFNTEEIAFSTVASHIKRTIKKDGGKYFSQKSQ